MGRHTLNHTSPSPAVRTGPPLITSTPAPPDNAALLEIIRPLHPERVTGLAALQALLIRNVALMATITEWNGWPFLHAYAVADLRIGNRARYIRVGCGYWREDWWYVTPGDAGTNVIAAMSTPDVAAQIIAGVLL